MKYSSEDKEKIVPIVENLKLMEKTAGWKWLKEEINKDVEKELDNLIENDNIKAEIIRGKVMMAKSIFAKIDFYYKQYQRIMEGENV